MKEAAGEANLTVVAIILIAVVVAVATPIVRSSMSTAAWRSCCTDSGMTWKKSYCFPESANNMEEQDGMYWEFFACAQNNGYSGTEITQHFKGKSY